MLIDTGICIQGFPAKTYLNKQNECIKMGATFWLDLNGPISYEGLRTSVELSHYQTAFSHRLDIQTSNGLGDLTARNDFIIDDLWSIQEY
jgi:hypothetical protein